MAVRLQYFVLVLCCSVLLCVPSAHGAQSSSGSTTLTLTVLPQCSVTIISQSPSGSGSSASQVLTFLYKVRTATPGGQGEIVLRFPKSGDYPDDSNVNYQTQIEGPGTSSSGSTATSEAANAGIVIARFGSHASSTRAGATGTLQYTVNPTLSAPLQKLQPSLSISCR